MWEITASFYGYRGPSETAIRPVGQPSGPTGVWASIPIPGRNLNEVPTAERSADLNANRTEARIEEGRNVSQAGGRDENPVGVLPANRSPSPIACPTRIRNGGRTGDPIRVCCGTGADLAGRLSAAASGTEVRRRRPARPSRNPLAGRLSSASGTVDS